MMCEPSIFPAAFVLSAIESEDLEKYLYVRPPPKRSVKELLVSSDQLMALLVLASKEWPADTKVPQRVCTATFRAVLSYT
jgi:hypothetical protein